MGLTSIRYLDASGEESSFQINTPTLTVANVENFTSEVATNAYADLMAAIDALTLMNRVGGSVGAKSVAYAGAQPADQNAQRERRLLLKFRDTVTGLKGSCSVPGIDLSLVGQGGTDAVDLAQTQVAALVAILEADYVSNAGNPILFYEARHVGRNN